MNKADLYIYPRKTPQEILAEIPADTPNRDAKIVVAFESAMNLEWWRGYHADHNPIGF